MSSIVFIDSRVLDSEQLLAGLAADVQVVYLDPTQDGIGQIGAALEGLTALDAIHIVSHGESGTLYLGSTVLTEENLQSYETQLSQIGSSLTADGDLLLYGCNVAEGDTGRSFIQALAQHTQADVAASTDATGSSSLNQVWMLEASIGRLACWPRTLR